MNLFLYAVLLTWLRLAVNGASATVSLTVSEGGELTDLVGPQCPGEIRLVCVGVNLTLLRWRYNGATNIYSFEPDNELGTVPLSVHPAFINTTLDAVTQAPNRLFANFTSTLIVDLGQLQSVTDIVCGDSEKNASTPVNVTLLQPTIPTLPRITCIVVSYQPSGLSSIDAAWEKSEAVCSATLCYEINVGTSAQTISQSSCGEKLCIAQQLSTSGEAVTAVSLSAINNIGPSGTATYPIEQDSGQYFTPEIFGGDNCDATVQCVSGSNLSENAICSVQYTSDSIFTDLSGPVMSPVNTMFPLPQKLQPNTTYFFVFSVMVDEILTVNIHLEHSSGTCDPLIPDSERLAAIIAPVVVAVIIVMAAIIIVIIIVIVRRTAKAKKKTVGAPGPSNEEMELHSVKTLDSPPATSHGLSTETGQTHSGTPAQTVDTDTTAM